MKITVPAKIWKRDGTLMALPLAASWIGDACSPTLTCLETKLHHNNVCFISKNSNNISNNDNKKQHQHW